MTKRYCPICGDPISVDNHKIPCFFTCGSCGVTFYDPPGHLPIVRGQEYISDFILLTQYKI